MIVNIICSLLGLAFVFLINMGATKKQFKLANEQFSYAAYFQEEAIFLATSVIVIVLVALCRNEFFNAYPKLELFEHSLFAMVGALGAWAFGKWLGKSQKYIEKVIDEKTNIADGKTP